MGTFLIRQTEIPLVLMGGINAYLRMFFMSAVPLSAFLQGVFISRFGIIPSFIFGGVFLWVTAYFATQVAPSYQKCLEKKNQKKDLALNSIEKDFAA